MSFPINDFVPLSEKSYTNQWHKKFIPIDTNLWLPDFVLAACWVEKRERIQPLRWLLLTWYITILPTAVLVTET